jgi:hypothetical protein
MKLPDVLKNLLQHELDDRKYFFHCLGGKQTENLKHIIELRFLTCPTK